MHLEDLLGSFYDDFNHLQTFFGNFEKCSSKVKYPKLLQFQNFSVCNSIVSTTQNMSK